MTVQTPLWPFVPASRLVDITHAKGCILHTRGGGEIRGEGLLRGIEIVKDRETLERFPESTAVTQRVIGAGLKRGVFFYGGGTGAIRDIICLGPAFIVSDAELDRMAETLKAAIDEAVVAV